MNRVILPCFSHTNSLLIYPISSVSQKRIIECQMAIIINNSLPLYRWNLTVFNQFICQNLPMQVNCIDHQCRKTTQIMGYKMINIS